MPGKFFTRRPQKGKPLAMRGLADGLAGMDNAWATLTGEGCQISWAQGTPTIVIESGSGWELGGDYLACYGESIGAFSGVGSATSVIDLINRELEGGVWNVADTTDATATAGALKVVGGVNALGGLYVQDNKHDGDNPIAWFSMHPDESDDFVKISGGLFGDESILAEMDGFGTASVNGLWGIRHDLGVSYSYILGAAAGSLGVYTTGDIEAVGDIESAGVYKVGGDQVVGARGLAVASPAGQTNDLDTEARASINAIIDRLEAHGLISL
jgi:hypothetical protein